MKIGALSLLLLMSTAAGTERLSLGGAAPGITRQQLETNMHGTVHCKRPEHPMKPLDAADVDCMRPADLAHSGFFAGESGSHPITFVYRFRHGKLGAIYVLGLKPDEYTALLSGLVEKFSTPDKVEKSEGQANAGATVENQWDAWTDGNNVLELRRVAAKQNGAGLRLVTKWYRDEVIKSSEGLPSDGT